MPMFLVKICRAAVSFSVAVCLASCLSQEHRAVEPIKNDRDTEADRRIAEAKLALLLSSKKRSLPEEKPEETASVVPQYDPIRLKKAENLKRWAGVRVPEVNIDAYLKSSWKDGRLNLRLALLGQKAALELFNSSWTRYRLSFAAQDGTSINQVVIPTSDMHFAGAQANNNIPTLEFEGSQECSLDVYEQSVQWNFEWEQ